jgi:hypothetical protein
VERVRLGRSAFVLIAAGLLGVGIYVAAVRGLADAHYTNARLLLSAATQEKRLPAESELTEARASLGEAHRLEPSNPLFVEQLARTQEMAALRLDPRDPAARTALLQSLAGMREAALMRPGSPYVWVSIAALKLRLDDLDFEFYGALERAERFGRWEPAVQLAITEVGLAGWGLLAQPAKGIVLGAIERALPRQSAEIKRLTAMPGTLSLVCTEPKLPPQVAALCVKK